MNLSTLDEMQIIYQKEWLDLLQVKDLMKLAGILKILLQHRDQVD